MAQPQRAHERLPYPAVGEVFELTASEEITALGLVADFGYNPDGWRFKGRTVPAGTTRRFKLVRVGYQENLAAAARACKREDGKNTNGGWVKVFNETFGHNGVNPVGVPDASWEDPRGNARFPVVSGNGSRIFHWAGHDRLDDWLWLVEVSE